MTGMIHATHSIVVTCAGNSECSKCWSCVCHDSNKLTRPCTKGEVQE
jgi:hypothetical protein